MKLLKNHTGQSRKNYRIDLMDTGNIIAFLKKFSFGRLIGCGIVCWTFKIVRLQEMMLIMALL